jgi:hypothetical protein
MSMGALAVAQPEEWGNIVGSHCFLNISFNAYQASRSFNVTRTWWVHRQSSVFHTAR